MKNMFNEYEALRPEVADRFDTICKQISEFIREAATEFSTIEIEHHLVGIVTTTCAVERIRKAVELRKKNYKKDLTRKTNNVSL